MALKLAKVRCTARKDRMSYHVSGVVHQGDFRSSITLILEQKGTDANVHLSVDCSHQNMCVPFHQFCRFADLKKAWLSCTTPSGPKQPARFRMTFKLAPRNRAYRECLSIVEQTIRSIEETLALIH